MITRICLAAVLAGVTIQAAKADAGEPRFIQVHGDQYENACTAGSLRKLKADLHAQKVKSPAELFKAIHVLLCAPVTSTNQRYISKVLMPYVDRAVDQTEEDPPGPVRVKSSELTPSDLFAQQVAYGLSVSRRHGALEVSYQPDSVCIARKTFRYENRQWRLTALMAACE